MARIATKYVDWKIFVDGIEIPWIAFSVSVGIWNGGAASIIIEPDQQLQRKLRPTSLVHIFLYDDLEEEGDDYDKYKLWWEGEVAGYTTTKSGTSRSVSLDCMGIISFLQKTSMYALGLGSIANTHILTGSTLLQSTDAATLAVRKEIIPEELSQDEDDKGPLPSGVTLDFGERVLNVLAYLLSFNAVGRLNAVRRDIFGKITTIKDAAIGRMIPRVVAQPFFEQALAAVSGGSSLLDLVKTMSGALFYDFVSTTGPVKRNVDSTFTETNRYHYLGRDWQEKKKNIYSIPAFNFRNDYFFTPKIYYAFPPACNIIFPEFNSNITLSRTFFDDPTRVIISTTVGANLSVVAPDSIFRFTTRKITPGEFWSNNADGIRQEGQTKSPYINANLNLFAAATDIEIERGILAPQLSPDFEVFSAVSNLFDLREEKNVTRMQSILKELGDLTKASAKVGERFATRERSYVYALKAIADYYYKLERFKRTVALQMDGHRWLVPGLPCTILDTDQSYVGLLTSHTFAVDAEGNETSTINLNYTRPFPEINANLVSKMEEEQLMLGENEKNLKSIESAVEDKKKQLADQVKKLLAEITRIEGIEAAARRAIDDATTPVQIDAAHASLKRVELTVEAALVVFKDNPELEGFIRTSSGVYTHVKVDPDTKVNTVAMERSLQVLNQYLITVRSLGGESFTIKALEARKIYFEEAMRSISSVRSAIVSLEKDVNTYYDERVVMMQKATIELSAVPALYGFTDKASKLSSSINKTEFDESLFAEDFFAPPIFANLDLIDLKKSSKFYKDLVGSKPIVEAEDNPEMTDPNVSNLKQEAYRRFLEFADEMNKIFPIYGVSKSATEWGRKIDQPETAQSVRRWEEKKYLRREGLLSLREFAKIHELKIVPETSEEPTIMEFLTLVPASFGNSIFDKIVDEFTLYPRTVVVKTPEGGTESVSLDHDEAIAKLRSSIAFDSMLFAVNRQALILDYSKQHFGARAFDGR